MLINFISHVIRFKTESYFLLDFAKYRGILNKVELTIEEKIIDTYISKSVTTNKKPFVRCTTNL